MPALTLLMRWSYQPACRTAPHASPEMLVGISGLLGTLEPQRKITPSQFILQTSLFLDAEFRKLGRRNSENAISYFLPYP